jgi:hypothetical protein
MTTPIVHLLLNSEEQTDKQTEYDKTHQGKKRDRKQARKNSRRREISTWKKVVEQLHSPAAVWRDVTPTQAAFSLQNVFSVSLWRIA